jgi:hypothetical protein
MFPRQGKYAFEILRSFGMKDYKSRATLMITNLKKLRASDSNLVDPMMYRQLIGSLMYLINTRSYIFFVVNTLSQIITMFF